MKVDFNLLKTNISLPDFFRDVLKWEVDEGSTHKHPKFKSPDGSRTIVIKRNEKDQFTYWDLHNDSVKGSSVLDIMMDHVYEETGKHISMREAGEMLQTYVDSGKTVLPDHSDFNLNNELLDPDYIMRIIQKCQPLKDLSFLVNRGINPDVLQTREWQGIFTQRQHVVNKDGEVNRYTNTCVMLVNPSGIQGISQRNEHFKGAMGTRYDTVAASRIDRTSPIKLHLNESILDGLSYYQMNYYPNNDKNVLFVSSEGSLSDGQINTIQTIINKNEIQSLEFNYDNDLAGMIYTINALNLDFNNVNHGIDHISLSKGVLDNDKVLYLNLKLNDKDGVGENLFKTLFPDKLFDDYFDKESVQKNLINRVDDKLHYQVSFPQSTDFLKEVANNLIEYKYGKSVQLVLPIEKDFNDDLKKQIGKQQNINNQITM